ncbi:MAG: Lrp/AsnC ligand binding domain-containing protein [Acidimicrobiia bacterium]|nr:Lrp/AsnC ligand binding domain-containing protein [Acidimicrobiia bacterium]MBT8249600.1 Lrp/AsnC ligand binding domain-containing protein [Acidimicrobiia bacterium]NNC41880.1 Lrp/AsnC ligand binding domain-containing protein [Acidimicrobiia bacterium]NND13315.1 Lrp/AsnC ligand binding domain-containing protein [Acidimicrobiia bacterium]NNL27773.1 Lrp/AsnC ligand binding domain-containing protein [Acidimicrobiia bacterium]
MAVESFVLIQTEPGRTAEVVARLTSLPGIVRVTGVSGSYDVIAEAETRSIDEMGVLVGTNVTAVDGISRAVACPKVTI